MLENPEYPNDSEIFEFFNKFIGLENAREYFKESGIIFATNKHSEIAKYASKMIFGLEDFAMMKNLTSTKQDYSKISGFEIKTKKPIEEIRDFFQNGSIVKVENGLTIKTTTFDPKSKNIQVSYSFDHKTPGKMNLISKEVRLGDFQIEPGEDGTAKIVVFNHSKNEDYAAVKDIVNTISQNKENEIELISMTLDRFDLKKRIVFIDSVLKRKYLDWDLEEVISIRVRRGDETEELEEVQKEYLEGINDALLKGHNLRTNPFVKACEKSGYYFPAVIMKMTHKTEPYKIHLEVQFKFRPEMPEVNIDESFLIEKDGDKSFQLDPDFKKRELNNFIHDIFSIYDKLDKTR
jgi:calcineurin-like phosphoesterase family protein